MRFTHTDTVFGDKNNLETGLKWAQFGPNYYFLGRYAHQIMLDITAVYHNIQNQINLMFRSRENAHKTQILAIFGPFCPILGPDIFFFENRAPSLKFIIVYSRLNL